MYEKEITRRHRTAFVIAVDRSQSMCEDIRFGERTTTKAAAVCDVVNNIISELIVRSRRDDGVRDYYDIAVIGYSDGRVYPLLDPPRDFVSVSDLCRLSPRVKSLACELVLPDGSRTVRTSEVKEWIEPCACGDTPMYEAFNYIRDITDEWCRRPQNTDSFPPVIFNITDGEASDCDSEELVHAARQIKTLGTADGCALLINIHISAVHDSEAAIFPTDSEIADDRRYMRLLADCSSIMPAQFDPMIRELRHDSATGPFIAMSYNASITELISMLDIGSRSITALI